MMPGAGSAKLKKILDKIVSLPKFIIGIRRGSEMEPGNLGRTPKVPAR